VTHQARFPIKLVALFSLSLTWAACLSASHYKPSDADYPKPNPDAKHYIEITARVDPTLPVEFDAVFTANAASCMYHPEGSAFEGAGDFSYDVNFPIAMHQLGDHAEGKVATDAVLPGNCVWRFSAIIAHAHNEDVFHGKMVIQGQWVIEVAGDTVVKDTNPSLNATCDLAGPTFGKTGVELSCFDGLPWAWISSRTTSVQIEINGRP